MADQSSELAKRDPRTLLSKSYLVGADLCQQRAWLDLWYPKPFRVTEKVAFGSAVDLGIQIVLGARSAGISLTDQPDLLLAPLAEQIARTPTDPSVDQDEVLRAISAFRVWVDDVAEAGGPDFMGALTQHHIRVPIDGAGMVDAHPDVILRDGTIVDIKTAGKAKGLDAAATSYLELGLYALVRQIETGTPVPSVAYLTWVRSSRPYWQWVRSSVTEQLLRVAQERAISIKRAMMVDAHMNEGASDAPANYSFPGGPRFSGLCGDCQHSPAFGGRCSIKEGE